MTDDQIKAASESLMSEFDFHEAYRTYERMGWTWGCDSTAHTPSVKELRDRAEALIGDVTAGNGANLATTGRLTVVRHDYPSGQISLRLMLTPQSWDVTVNADGGVDYE